MIILTSSVESLADMMFRIAKSIYEFSKSISFAKNWIIKFLDDKYKKLYV